ncbi:MAG: hypothetical protein WC662_03700 [Candidatus Paceibacterota bacterium]|jgi:hypothetical protein
MEGAQKGPNIKSEAKKEIKTLDDLVEFGDSLNVRNLNWCQKLEELSENFEEINNIISPFISRYSHSIYNIDVIPKEIPQYCEKKLETRSNIKDDIFSITLLPFINTDMALCRLEKPIGSFDDVSELINNGEIKKITERYIDVIWDFCNKKENFKNYQGVDRIKKINEFGSKLTNNDIKRILEMGKSIKPFDIYFAKQFSMISNKDENTGYQITSNFLEIKFCLDLADQVLDYYLAFKYLVKDMKPSDYALLFTDIIEEKYLFQIKKYFYYEKHYVKNKLEVNQNEEVAKLEKKEKELRKLIRKQMNEVMNEWLIKNK